MPATSQRRLHDWSQFDVTFDDGQGITVLVIGKERRYDIRPNDGLADAIVAHIENVFAQKGHYGDQIDTVFAALETASQSKTRKSFRTSLARTLGTSDKQKPGATLASKPSVKRQGTDPSHVVAKFASHEYLSVAYGTASGIVVESDPPIDTAARRIVSFLEACAADGLDHVDSTKALALQAMLSSGICETADRALAIQPSLAPEKARRQAEFAVPAILAGTDVDKIKEAAMMVSKALRRSDLPATPAVISQILYAADLDHMADYGRPIVFDNYLATVDGPLSATLAAMVPRSDAQIPIQLLESSVGEESSLSRSDTQTIAEWIGGDLRTALRNAEVVWLSNEAFVHATNNGIEHLDYRLMVPDLPQEKVDEILLCSVSLANDPLGPKF